MARSHRDFRSSAKWSVVFLSVSAMLSTITFHRYIYHDIGRTELGTTVVRIQQLDENITHNSSSENQRKPHANITFTLKTTSRRESSLSPVCNPFASLVSSARPSHNQHSDTRRIIRRIYFAHMRKARGTTLRTYLASVAQLHDLEFVVSEGGHFELPGTNHNTLYVTHLRDPYGHAICHFQYEIRWPCEQLLQNESFEASQDNAANLTAWITEPGFLHPSLINSATTRRSRCDDTRAYLIDCATNCYIR
ncbi:hypothetical protein IV203_031637 [Nitzschia inconspicua]|uniref:Uncharacterized protein n=1 Tax=Nitzschia inconspicua TaxID=303405 RepID=A0A9K3Q592_9STRA|nr:hypothetical protein IV203_031637 [Nitzschia inconspicua]